MLHNSNVDLPDLQTTDSSNDLPIRARVENLNFYYGGKVHALKNIQLPIYDRQVTTLIGPSGSGKTTLLRCFNRMHDLSPGNRYEGRILLVDGSNLISNKIDPIDVRMRISMVFSSPNPLPRSIYENVAYGLRIRGEKHRGNLDDRVESALKSVILWDEVKHRLNQLGTNLSSGQQQRLCIARALATNPDIILLDEPTFGLDRGATIGIETAIAELKNRVTTIVVTHSIHQAARISDYTAFMHMGEIVEFDRTRQIFNQPSHQLTSDYINGKL
jgi:phosphate transport system ATP-binding protein